MILKEESGYKIELLAFEKDQDCNLVDYREKGYDIIYYGSKEWLLSMPDGFLLSILPVKYSQSYSKLGRDGCWYDTEPYPEELYNFKTKRWRKIMTGSTMNPKIFFEEQSIESAIEVCPGNHCLIIKTVFS